MALLVELFVTLIDGLEVNQIFIITSVTFSLKHLNLRAICEVSLTISFKHFRGAGVWREARGNRGANGGSLPTESSFIIQEQLEVITDPTTSFLMLITAVRGERHHLRRTNTGM